MKTIEILKNSFPDSSVRAIAGQYTGRFNKESSINKRLNNAAELNKEYYGLVTDFYLHGWGKMFHFGVRRRGESFTDSLVRHEMVLVNKLNLQPGDKCLDIGCGVAGPMINIAKKSGAQITGINNSAYQIDKANRFLKEEGLDNRCSVLECDWMKMPLISGEYDKAYAIEATCHASDKRNELFTEIYRVLKPGGLFTGYDWVMTDKYIPGNADHERIKHDIEIGDGISNLNLAADVRSALVEAGFEVLELRDVAKDCDPETPWYLPLKGDGFSLQMLRISPTGRWVMQQSLNVLEALRILPKGSSKIHKMLLSAADALVQGGERDIFTPMLFFLARKPG